MKCFGEYQNLSHHHWYVLLTKVERSSLPPEYQKQESIYNKVATFMNSGYIHKHEKTHNQEGSREHKDEMPSKLV